MRQRVFLSDAVSISRGVLLFLETSTKSYNLISFWRECGKPTIKELINGDRCRRLFFFCRTRRCCFVLVQTFHFFRKNDVGLGHYRKRPTIFLRRRGYYVLLQRKRKKNEKYRKSDRRLLFIVLESLYSAHLTNLRR